MFLAFLKNTLNKCPRRVLFAADCEGRLCVFFALLTVPMAPSWRRICDRYLASTRVCCSMQSASLQNVRFVEAKRLILCFALYTQLCYSFKKMFLEAQNGLKPCFLTQMLKSARLAACRSCQTKHYSNPSKYSKCAFRRGETLVFLVRFYVCKSRLSQTSGFYQSERPSGRKARTTRQPRRGDTSHSTGI